MPVPNDEAQPPDEEDSTLIGVPVEPSDGDFAPFDPTDPSVVAAPSPGPPSSDAPASDQEPLPAAAAKFDEQHKLPFEGLLFLGALKDSFSWAGHDFVIRTLRTDEVLEIALLSQPYRGTLGEDKAYQAAVSAGCLMSVDGQPVSIPLTDEPGDTPLANKFDYIKGHWFPPVLDVIYEKYLLLENKVLEVLKEMGKPLG